MSEAPKPLTPKEKTVLEFIEAYICQRGYSPTYQEIKEHFGFASFNSVQRYLKQLQAKHYLHIPGGNQKRAMTLINSPESIKQKSNSLHTGNQSSGSNATLTHPKPFLQQEASAGPTLPAGSLALPLLGRVAAGRPLEAIDHNETFDVPSSLVRNPSKSFVLKVEGDSMIEDGIFDGDAIVVQRQQTANNGEIVVASVENEATVKHYYSHFHQQRSHQEFNHNQNAPQVELRPANATMSSMWYNPDEVEIKGIVVGLIRKF